MNSTSVSGSFESISRTKTAIAAVSAAILLLPAIAQAAAVPSGVVSWWQAENNTLDLIGGNTGVLLGGAGFAAGKVAQAFYLNTSNATVKIPAAQNLNVGSGSGFTLEAWINPSNVAISGPLFEWNTGTGGWGVHFHIDPYSFSKGPGALHANIVDTSFGWHQLITPGGTVTSNVFQHVALTFDKTSRVAKIYCNGTVVTQATFTASFTPLTTYDLYLGRRPSGAPNDTYSYRGLIDEPTVYDRELTSTEIYDIWAAGTSGKTPPSPGSSTVPVITSFYPVSAAPGTLVTILGNNFSTTPANNVVYFGAVRATVLLASSGNLTVRVPLGATYAPLTVAVSGQVASSGQSFQPTFAGGAAIGSASFETKVDFAANDGPIFTAIADLNNDGKPDLVVNNAYANSISLYRNISAGGSLSGSSFDTPVNISVGGGADNPYGLTVADVNGDGKLDVIICDRINHQVAVYSNNITGTGAFTSSALGARVSLNVGNDPRHAVVVDLNRDGKPDIVSANYVSNSISILQNTGNPASFTFATHLDLPVATGSYDIAAADLDGDLKPDLAVAAASYVSLIRNLSSGGNLTAASFAPRVDLATGSGGISIAIGDLDNDRLPDLTMTTYMGQQTSVFRNQMTAPGSFNANSFAARVDFSPGSRGHTLALSDVNGDGRADLIFVGEISDKLLVYENLSTPGSFSTSSFATADSFTTGSNPWGVAVGDLDGDGRPDMVFNNIYSDTISIYQNKSAFLPPANVVVTCTSQSNFVFQGDTTYYVSNAVTLKGTTTFEGGAVIKYVAGASLTVSNVNCLATAYRPVIFTARDDNSVGEIISGSTGSPGYGAYANPALNFDGPASVDWKLSNFRIANAQTAVKANSASFALTLSHGQIVNCQTGIDVPNGTGTLALRNLLLAEFHAALKLCHTIVSAENTTFATTDSNADLVLHNCTPSSEQATFVNCIITGVEYFSSAQPSFVTGDHNGFFNCAETDFGTSSFVGSVNPFQTKVAANYYLAELTGANNFRDRGATSINTTLLAELKRKTTWPPTVQSNQTITAATTWLLQAPRDADSSPDLGYHYDPLDYVVDSVSVQSTLTLDSGVAVATKGYFGFLISGGTVSSAGKAETHNQITPYQMVQEQPVLLNGLSVPAAMTLIGIFQDNGSLDLRFTDVGGGRWHNSIWSYAVALKARDCQFGPGTFYLDTPNGAVASTEVVNNIFERSYVWFGSFGFASTLNFYNNLARRSFVGFIDDCGGYTRAVRDNLLESSSVAVLAGTGEFAHDHNGYFGMLPTVLAGTTSGNQALTVLKFATAQPGLGPFYIDTTATSPSLINVGSRAASTAGLFHHTLRTSQLKEGNDSPDTVDIGFHYVALDGSGKPVDSDGDGLPDYFEDTNGNGVFDAGDRSDFAVMSAAPCCMAVESLRCAQIPGQ